MRDNQFPTVDNCDVNDPEERFLPYFVGIPGMKGAPLPFPVGYLRQVSRRISEAMTVECRAALAAEEPSIKYRKPRSDSPHWFSDPGSWVSIDEPDPAEPTLAEIADQLPLAERAALKKHLEDAAAEIGIDADDSDVLVAYTKADGSTTMVTPKQAAAYEAKRKDKA